MSGEKDKEEDIMDTTVMTMPVIALRGLTVLPKMTMSFDISRSRSVAAVEKAMVSDQKICIVTQKIPILYWNSFTTLEWWSM